MRRRDKGQSHKNDITIIYLDYSDFSWLFWYGTKIFVICWMEYRLQVSNRKSQPTETFQTTILFNAPYPTSSANLDKLFGLASNSNVRKLDSPTTPCMCQSPDSDRCSIYAIETICRQVFRTIASATTEPVLEGALVTTTSVSHDMAP